MSSKASMRLQSALMSTGLVQPVSEKSRGGYVEVLCRQIPGQEKEWLRVVEALLTYASGSAGLFEFHICRRYVLKNGQMVFGWHISMDCKNTKTLDSQLDMMLAEVLDDARASLGGPVTEDRPVTVAAPQAPQTPSGVPLAPGRHPPPRAALPRQPNPPGTIVGTPPPPGSASLKVVQNFRDENGRVTIVEEMALPHVHEEMNRPNSKGRGAKLTGGG